MYLQMIDNMTSSAPPPMESRRLSLQARLTSTSEVKPIPPQNCRHESGTSRTNLPALSFSIDASLFTSFPSKYKAARKMHHQLFFSNLLPTVLSYSCPSCSADAKERTLGTRLISQLKGSFSSATCARCRNVIPAREHPGGKCLDKIDGDAPHKIGFKPLNETIVGVAPAFFDP